MKTAVIYARYSSDSQTEQSIEGQLRVCKDFAQRNDILVVDSYIDRAMTGTNDNRAAFQKMLRDSAKKQWQIVLVYKLDRFSRNKYEAVIHKKTLKDNGVKLVSAMENIPDSPEGALMESVLEGFNQYYSEELRQKVNRGLRESWIKGNATGSGHKIGYDVINKKYVINEREAAIIRELFSRYASGEVVSTILHSFNERGIVRSNGRKFTKNNLFNYLHDIRYSGKVEHKGVVYDNIFPPIITEETWKKVAAICEENKESPSRKKDAYDYILSSKLVCGICKRRMHGISGTSQTGNTYAYYVCKHKNDSRKCANRSYQKEIIENIVINAISNMLNGSGTVQAISERIIKLHKKATSDNATLKVLQQNRDAAYKASRNLIKAVEQGIITDQTKERLTELEIEISQLDFEIQKEKNRKLPFLEQKDIILFLANYLKGDFKTIKFRKIIMNTFVREIVLFPDKIVITLNYIEPTEPTKITKEITEDVLKQSETAFLLNQSSSKITDRLPEKAAQKCRLFW